LLSLLSLLYLLLLSLLSLLNLSLLLNLTLRLLDTDKQPYLGQLTLTWMTCQ